MPTMFTRCFRSPRFWLLILLLLAAWLGARGLNADAFWYDEYWSLNYAGGAEYGPLSLADTVQRVASQYTHEKNPPGYYVLLNLWGHLTGWSEFAGRSLSWLAGILAVAWMYRLGYDTAPGMDTRSRQIVGLGAAAALGGSAFIVDYLHEMRVYIFSVLFAVIILWTYWRILTTPKKSGFWLQSGLVLSLAGSLYLHYSGVVVLGALALYHLLIAPKNNRWWRLTFLAAAGGLLFVPWLPILLDATARAQNLRLTAMTTGLTLAELFYVFSNGSLALLALLVVYGLADPFKNRLLAYSPLSISMARRPEGAVPWFIGLLAVGSLLLGLGLNAVYPFVNHIRYLIVLWPLLALVVGLGVARLAQWGVHPAVLLVIWVGAGLWNSFNPAFVDDLTGAFPHQSWRELAAVLTERAQPDDVLAFHAADFDWMQAPVLTHYLYGLPIQSTLMETLPGLPANHEYKQQAQTFVGDASRVWLGVNKLYPANFRLAEFERALMDDYVNCAAVLDLPDLRLDLYARLPQTVETMPVQFGSDIGLEPVETIATQKGLSVTLGWLIGDNVPPDTYSVALHILDAAGNLVTQDDYGLPNERRACQQRQLPVPPGAYTVRLGVYNWQTGESLPAANAETGDFMTLAGIVVP